MYLNTVSCSVFFFYFTTLSVFYRMWSVLQQSRREHCCFKAVINKQFKCFIISKRVCKQTGVVVLCSLKHLEAKSVCASALKIQLNQITVSFLLKKMTYNYLLVTVQGNNWPAICSPMFHVNNYDVVWIGYELIFGLMCGKLFWIRVELKSCTLYVWVWVDLQLCCVSVGFFLHCW